MRTLGKGVAGVGHGADRKRQNAVQTILFPIGSLSAPETPQSLRDSSPKRGAKGVDESRRAYFGIVRTTNRRSQLTPTSVIPPKGTRRQSRRRERAKPDVGIRSPYAAVGVKSVPRGCGLPRRSSLTPRNDR